MTESATAAPSSALAEGNASLPLLAVRGTIGGLLAKMTHQQLAPEADPVMEEQVGEQEEPAPAAPADD